MDPRSSFVRSRRQSESIVDMILKLAGHCEGDWESLRLAAGVDELSMVLPRIRSDFDGEPWQLQGLADGTAPAG